MPYREAAIGIVVDNSGRFLVVTHSAASDIYAWRFPGGGVEKGEMPEETISREFEEEFGTNKYEFLLPGEQPGLS